MLKQVDLFPDSAEHPGSTDRVHELRTRSGSFIDNMKLPIHRWFRYSAGFSADWAEDEIRAAKATRVLDPFAGSGTTLLAADACGVPSVGIEAHPFVARVGRAKLHWDLNPEDLCRGAARLLEHAVTLDAKDVPAAPDLLLKCYEPDALKGLFRLRDAFVRVTNEVDPRVSELLFLAITAILRECSFVGTAQWQYVLPTKRKRRVVEPTRAFAARVEMFAADIEMFASGANVSRSTLLSGDARTADCLVSGQFDLLLTSPPYPNNYDYADATRLEMTFWGEIESWGDIHEAVRRHLVRSSSQHSAKERLELDILLVAPELAPIRYALTEVCNELAAVRETKGGRKSYHTMVAAYFADMADVMRACRPLMMRGGRMCWVIGDSAPYGVYVPVDKWLTTLATAAGFGPVSFEKLRDRNTKWKNRKHTVPLLEGRLWIET